MAKSQSSPTTFLSLALCCHMVTYVMVWIATFTPKWSDVTVINGSEEISYSKGAIISCKVPGGPSACSFNREISDASTEFFICFLLVIASLIFGFFALQLLCCGLCVKSIKRRNLGAPLTGFFFFLATLLVGCIVLFEISMPKDVPSGHEFEDGNFGLSRILLAAATGLYFLCAVFALAEHLKRSERHS